MGATAEKHAAATGGGALEPGMILSNEPGYYKKGAYGIRIENLMARNVICWPSRP